MAIKVNGNTAVDDTRKGTFNILNVGSYTTANRPSSPIEGDWIYDSDEKKLLCWNGTEWKG